MNTPLPQSHASFPLPPPQGSAGSTSGAGVNSSDPIREILSRCYWTASVSHSWEEGRGARKFTNSSLASVDGEFKTEEEAMEAARNAIANRAVRTRGHSINYSRANPYVSFCIPHKLIGEIGRALAAKDPAKNLEGGE